MTKIIISKIWIFLNGLLKETFRTAWILFKIMIPISIIVKILQYFGAIEILGKILFPLMKFTGLPGEMGIVWATGMITNLFGGIIAYLSLLSNINLNIAQITVLSSMMLIAHSFPIELQIAKKSGSKLIPMFLLRFLASLFYGIILNFIFKTFNLFNDFPKLNVFASPNNNLSILEWIINEMKHYAIILLFIFSLLLLLKILKKIGFIDLMSRLLNPLLSLIGIGRNATPLTIIGLTLGITYGGALIIEQSKSLNISKPEVFYSMVLMGLCHSIIEDTLLVLSLGSSIWGILVGRLVFAILLTFFIVKFSKIIKTQHFNKLFINKN